MSCLLFDDKEKNALNYTLIILGFAIAVAFMIALSILMEWLEKRSASNEETPPTETNAEGERYIVLKVILLT